MAQNQAPAPKLAITTPGPPLNEVFFIAFGVTGQKYQGPNFRISPGMTVTIYPVKPDGTVNASPMSIASRPELLGTSGARTVPPGADVSVGWPCQSALQIWLNGAAGDGALIAIQEAAFG